MGAVRALRRRPAIAGATTLALAIALVALVIAASGGGSSSAASPTTSTATTKIVRQDLVEIDTEDGTLGYTDTQPVINHASGYVTWLPAQGAVIRPDHVLYRVNGSPVVLLDGRTPAYRTLDASASGADVRELERNLRSHGYDPAHDMAVDGTWTSATTSAVERFQKAHGLSQTGSLTLGQVVFLPGARRVQSLNADLGGAAAAGGSGAGASSTGGATSAAATASTASATNTSTAIGRSRAQLVDYVVPASKTRTSEPVAHAAQTGTSTTETTTPTTTTTTATTPAATTTTPPPPTATTPTATTPTATRPSVATSTGTQGSGSARGSGGVVGGGPVATAASTGTPSGTGSGGATQASSGASTANTIMTTTSTRRVVTVELATTKSELARPGAPVTVQLPAGNYVHGHISSIGKVATAASSSGSGGSSSSSSGSATITVTIRLGSRGSSLDQAPVTVRFQQSRVRDALSIPVTALLARPGGAFGVEVVSGSSHRLVTVTPGLYTSGYVQIAGAGLQPGMLVTNAAVQ